MNREVEALARDLFVAAAASEVDSIDPAWAFHQAEAFIAERDARLVEALLATSHSQEAHPPPPPKADPAPQAVAVADPAPTRRPDVDLTPAQSALLLGLLAYDGGAVTSVNVKLNVVQGLVNAGLVQDTEAVKDSLRTGNRLAGSYPLTDRGREVAKGLKRVVAT